MHCVPNVVLDLLGALVSIAAAIFWFRGSGKLPRMDTLSPDDPAVIAFHRSMSMNRIAAILTGVAALLVAASLAIEAYAPRCNS